MVMLYPCTSSCIGKAVALSVGVHSSISGRYTLTCGTYLHCKSNVQVILPHRGCRATASQLDLSSLTPLSVAGCGRLHLGVAHWDTSVALPQVVDN